MIPVRVARRTAARRLADAGIPSPDNDAEVLLAFALGVERGALHGVEGLDGDAVGRYFALVEHRADRVPLQHLVGMAGFRRIELDVGPGVFVPRPETELLVEWGVTQLARCHRFGPVVVDLCAGSGAIALAVAQEVPDALVYAVERDPRALSWAHRNAETRIAAGDLPITLCLGDATGPGTLPHLDGIVDLVLANPPYVPDGTQVDAEVADYDPPAALWGGADGLDVLRGVADRACALLRPGGWFAVEHADTHGVAVPTLLTRMGDWTDVADHCDLAGRARFATARRA
ncbi:MAG TPA: peptide chain release factor N(5)-glutamine methyltransferase [Mycobacteriales bacterium]|nr:peptide chain release factor N(5)-glutamine methyltransferase [Mycobacteriales bacterium]